MFIAITTAWHQLDFKLVLILFCAYVLVDGMYALYTLDVTKREPFRAATIGALMHFILAFGVLNYVNNFLYIIPLALGSWIGTYVVVMREKVKKTHVNAKGVEK